MEMMLLLLLFSLLFGFCFAFVPRPDLPVQQIGAFLRPQKMVLTESHLQDLGISLPPAPKAAANYVPVVVAGNLLYLSGHLPLLADGKLMTGRIGTGAQSLEHGYQAARQVGLNLIATLKQELGDLDRVERIIKLFGIVQSTEEFKQQHLCMNGVSDVLVEVFGDRGVHARSAIGANCLPLDISVEVEAIVQIKPSS
jgi:enamine deaminase RidA (YjgF/YER057c/UK114 family)